MKKNFQKFGKLTLSIALAFAVVAVSLFTAAPALSINAGALTATDTWDGTMTEPTTTDANGNIIINNAEELAWVALKGTTAQTANKNYKVVDNAVFNLNGMTGITLDSTAGDVSTATATANVWKLDAANRNQSGNQQKSFAGNFDGNGVIIYNMYAADGYSGLFPHIAVDNATNTCSFRGITIKASYIKGYHFAAAIVGMSDMAGAGRNLNFTDCKVENCYINATDSNTACKRTGGLFVGSGLHSKITIENGIAVNNVISATNIKGGFVGNTSAYANDAVIKNSVVIGSTPYAVKLEGSNVNLEDKTTKASCYSNVYTDQDVNASYAGAITKVAVSDMKGAAAMGSMPNLDWTKLIAFDGEHPDFRANHTITVSTGDAAGHSATCSDCGKSVTEEHAWVENAATSTKECSSCGYAVVSKLTSKWDGTQPSSFAASGITGGGNPGDPYVIATAAQLWYIAQKAGAASAGKYFKVADNIGTFDMDNKPWGLADNNSHFQGTFDGNGVKIINLKVTGYNASLFPNVSGNVTIKNLRLSGANIRATGANAGGIVANINGSATTDVTISNCVVENVTVNAVNAAGAVVATAANGPKLTIDNCLVKNNAVDSQNGAIYSGGPSYMDGVMVGLGWQSASYTLSNSIIIGSDPTKWIGNFSKVYTDQNVSESTYAPEQIKFLTTAQMSGANGVENMNLDFAKVWFANAGIPELRVLHSVASVDNGDGTHSESCSACNLVGLTANHTFVNGECACGATCAHTGKVWNPVTEGGCAEADTGYWSCEACGYESATIDNPNTDKGKGHVLTKQTAVGATCKDDGKLEHWTCSVCQGIFLTDDKMSTDVKTIDDIIVKATGNHVPLKDTTGDNIQYMKEEGYHSEICAVCGDFFNKVACTAQYTTTETTHSGKCTVCLQDIVAGAHNFDEEGKCDICEYQCLHTNASEPKEENRQGATCTQDGSYESVTYCENCDKELSRVPMSITAPGHDFENKAEIPATKTERGTKAHKHCKVCDKNFDVDAAANAPDSEALSAEDLILLSLNEIATNTWDGATMPETLEASGIKGEGTPEKPYIIQTAAQMWYIAQKAGAASAGKYYKVDENVATFDLNNKAWGLADNSCHFQGTFDGNGVQIINFNANGYFAGLFPNVSGNVTIKNIKVSGAQVASAAGNAGTIICNINGTANVVVSNCVVENSTITSPAATGALVATAANGPFLTIDNCLVKNNTVTTTYTGTDIDYKSNGVLGLGWKSDNYTLSNSIILGNEPTYWIKNFDKVYTDQTVNEAYTAKEIKSVTLDQISGASAVENTNLDFEKVWFANAGIPELRVLHSFSYEDNGDGTHNETCAECGMSSTVQVSHTFDKDGNCIICDYVNPCVESGHDFKTIDEVPATFESTGFAAHKLCKVCGYKFAVDADKNVSVSEALSDNVLIIPVRQHEIECDENGKKIQYFDDKAHWFNCADCDGGKYQYGEHTMEERVLEEGVYKWCEDAEGNACGYELFDYAISNEEGTVFVSATTNAVSKNVITDIVEFIEEAYGYEEIDKLFKAAGYTSFTAYDVSPTDSVAEGGKVTIKIKVPDTYGDSAAIYSVDYKSGKLVKLATKIVEETVKDNKNKDVTIYYAVVETDSFGIFAVAADKPQNAGSTENDADTNTNTNNGSGSGSIIGGATGGDQSTTSPATSADTMAEIAVMTVLFGAAVVFARKAKKA